MSALVCPCPPCSFAINVPANDVVSIALYLKYLHPSKYIDEERQYGGDLIGTKKRSM